MVQVMARGNKQTKTKKAFTRIIKRLFEQFGLDIVRLSRKPTRSLLGLRDFDIKTIIDVGANRGQFARMLLNVFPEAHIYCFEPLPELFRQLSRWSEEQRNGKVTVYNLALGNKEGFLRMFRHIEHNSSSSFLKTTKLCESLYPFSQKQDSITVKLTTLDNWLKSLPSPPMPKILLKVDVQGYEDKVVQGGRETFSKAEACILEVSLDKLYEDQATFRDISLLLYDLGYHYVGNLDQSYADDGHVIFIDAVFVKHQ